MTKYTIRVELHDASAADYKELAKQLAARGITDIIKNGDGERYKLPPAEYNYEGTATRAAVMDMAKAAAQGVVKSFAVLVTESNGRTWHGLERA